MDRKKGNWKGRSMHACVSSGGGGGAHWRTTHSQFFSGRKQLQKSIIISVFKLGLLNIV